MSRRTRDRDEAEGAVAVTTAILLTVLLVLTALVVDIGFLRMDERESQLSADLASAAAFLPADEFNPAEPGAGREACLNAWDYLLANIEGLSSMSPSQVPSGAPCDAFGTATVCTATPVETTSTVVAGPYTIELTYPVLDHDDPGAVLSDELMAARKDNSDGSPCDRFGIRVLRDRSYFLAGVIGQASGATRPSAVARWVPGEDGNFASLVVVDQIQCLALNVSGQGGINVANYVHPTDPTKDVPGEMTVDSDASKPGNSAPQGECDNSYAIDVQGTTQGYARAEGAINSKAMDAGNTPHAYDPSDLTTAAQDGEMKLKVPPIPNSRETRLPIDRVGNCEEQYPAPGDPGNREYHPQHETVEPVEGCAAFEERPPYVKRLYEFVQPRLIADFVNDTDWTVYPDDFMLDPADPRYDPAHHIPASESSPCVNEEVHAEAGVTPVTDKSEVPPVDETASQYLYINCGTTGSTTFSPLRFEADGFTHIVSENKVNLGSGALLQVNGDMVPEGTILYLRNGDITKGSSGTLTLHQVFVYLNSTTSSFVRVGASDTTVTWQATGTDPDLTAAEQEVLRDATEAHCDTTYASIDPPLPDEGILPPSTCLSPIGLWSNGNSLHSLGGQGALDISGSFFTPNALPFRLGGQANQTLTAAQFFSRQIEVAGQGLISMTPNPFASVETSEPQTSLIR